MEKTIKDKRLDHSTLLNSTDLYIVTIVKMSRPNVVSSIQYEKAFGATHNIKNQLYSILIMRFMHTGTIQMNTHTQHKN